MIGLLRWLGILLAVGVVVVGGYTYWSTSGGSPVQDWKCVVTDNPNASSGGGAVYEAGNCAVLLSGCRRQSACYYTDGAPHDPDASNTYTVVGMNLSDPAVQSRLE